MFDRLVHADWSMDARKRWQASALRREGCWAVAAPTPVGPVQSYLDRAFEASDRTRTLLGFDFPIGLPAAYGEKTGLPNFREALPLFGQGDWSTFFHVSDLPDEISLRRPFYPRASQKGVSRSTLVAALGVTSFDDLLRVCERRTADRQAACSIFWTLGGNQVGKAAIAGWREVIGPALQRGATLWPFDGPLSTLSQNPGVVLCETYPADAYRMFGAGFTRSQSKRRQTDRAAKASAIFAWAQMHAVALSDEAKEAVRDGFGAAGSGEDAFDALAGLLKMIEIADGRRPETTLEPTASMRWEGGILGR